MKTVRVKVPALVTDKTHSVLDLRGCTISVLGVEVRRAEGGSVTVELEITRAPRPSITLDRLKPNDLIACGECGTVRLSDTLACQVCIMRPVREAPDIGRASGYTP